MAHPSWQESGRATSNRSSNVTQLQTRPERRDSFVTFFFALFEAIHVGRYFRLLSVPIATHTQNSLEARASGLIIVRHASFSAYTMKRGVVFFPRNDLFNHSTGYSYIVGSYSKTSASTCYISQAYTINIGTSNNVLSLFPCPGCCILGSPLFCSSL